MKKRLLNMMLVLCVGMGFLGCGGGGGSGGSGGVTPVDPTSFTIIDSAPLSGAPGSALFLMLDESVQAQADLLVAYFNGTEMSIADIVEDTVQVIIPETAQTGTTAKISLGLNAAVSNEVSFSVAATQTTLLYETQVAPSAEEQVINWNDRVKVRIPSGVLTEAQNLSISQVTDIPVNPLLPFESNAVDISIGDLHALPGAIEIGFKYDPAVIDPEIDPIHQLAFYKWDEQYEVWQPLAFRVDPAEEMVYVETDHLCVILGGSIAGVAGLLGQVIIPPAIVAGVYEKVAYTTYVSQSGNFSIVYHRPSLDALLTNWQTPSKLTGPVALHPSHPAYIAEIGALFEMALANYMARGFKNPVVKPGWFWGENHTPITVKISGLYGVLTDEPVYEKVFGAIHLPSWLFHLYAQGMDPSFEKLMYMSIGHELFHRMQAEYYRAHRMMKAANTGDYWWVEATAEYAAAREAWGAGDTGLDEMLKNGVRADFFSHPFRYTGKPSEWSREYEYTMSQFVKFMVDVKGLDFEEMVEYVSTGNPLETLNNFILSNDNILHPGGALGAYYQQFARWGSLSADSFLNGFELANFEDSTVSRLNQIAWQTDTLEKTQRTTGLKIEATGGETSLIDYVVLTKEARASGLPAALKTFVGGDDEVLDVPPVGEVVYLLAVNYSGQVDQISANVSLARPVDPEAEEIEWVVEESVSHDFIMSAYSAQLWAIQIGGEEAQDVVITTSFSETFTTRWENPGTWSGDRIDTEFLISGTMEGSNLNPEVRFGGSFLGRDDITPIITLSVDVYSSEPIVIEASIAQPFSQWEWEWLYESETEANLKRTLAYQGAPIFETENTAGDLGTHPISFLLDQPVGDEPVYSYSMRFVFDPRTDFPDHDRFRTEIRFPFTWRQYREAEGGWVLETERTDWTITPASFVVEMRDRR